MADEKQPNGDETPEDDMFDSGLGNLPPLSDFDSTAMESSDGGLPPLGSFDAEPPADNDAEPPADKKDDGGLPPISEISVETPDPSGGAVMPTPAGFESGPSDNFSSGDSPLDTPEEVGEDHTGFQDLAADSDFSPETPDIGPGPDSGADTPMFDSAFGGDAAGFDSAVETPAPTQAMETPMFGVDDTPVGGGDQGAFGGDTGDMDFGGGFDAGTPPPDFSPDTEAQQAAAEGKGKKKKVKKAGGGGGGAGKVIAVAVIFLVIGLLAGPKLQFLPTNPLGTIEEEYNTQLRSKDANIAKLNKEIEDYKKMTEGQEEVQLSPEQRDQLRKDIVQLQEEKTTAVAELEQANSDLDNIQGELATINAEYEEAQESFEEIQNQMAIVEARQKGLTAEVNRLTRQVGDLEQANIRRVASLEALAHNVDRLIIHIKEAMPLTPEKYSHAQRLERAKALRDNVAQAQWLTPELQQEYTDIYLNELQIAQAKEYFFAKLDLRDRYGNLDRVWVECLMKGNTMVVFRSLDGTYVGSFENLGTAANPIWGLRTDYPELVAEKLHQEVIDARVAGAPEKIAALQARQTAAVESSKLQRNFDSL